MRDNEIIIKSISVNSGTLAINLARSALTEVWEKINGRLHEIPKCEHKMSSNARGCAKMISNIATQALNCETS